MMNTSLLMAGDTRSDSGALSGSPGRRQGVIVGCHQCHRMASCISAHDDPTFGGGVCPADVIIYPGDKAKVMRHVRVPPPPSCRFDADAAPNGSVIGFRARCSRHRRVQNSEMGGAGRKYMRKQPDAGDGRCAGEGSRLIPICRRAVDL